MPSKGVKGKKHAPSQVVSGHPDPEPGMHPLLVDFSDTTIKSQFTEFSLNPFSVLHYCPAIESLVCSRMFEFREDVSDEVTLLTKRMMCIMAAKKLTYADIPTYQSVFYENYKVIKNFKILCPKVFSHCVEAIGSFELHGACYRPMFYELMFSTLLYFGLSDLDVVQEHLSEGKVLDGKCFAFNIASATSKELILNYAIHVINTWFDVNQPLLDFGDVSVLASAPTCKYIDENPKLYGNHDEVQTITKLYDLVRKIRADKISLEDDSDEIVEAFVYAGYSVFIYNWKSANVAKALSEFSTTYSKYDHAVFGSVFKTEYITSLGEQGSPAQLVRVDHDANVIGTPFIIPLSDIIRGYSMQMKGSLSLHNHRSRSATCSTLNASGSAHRYVNGFVDK